MLEPEKYFDENVHVLTTYTSGKRYQKITVVERCNIQGGWNATVAPCKTQL